MKEEERREVLACIVSKVLVRLRPGCPLNETPMKWMIGIENKLSQILSMTSLPVGKSWTSPFEIIRKTLRSNLGSLHLFRIKKILLDAFFTTASTCAFHVFTNCCGSNYEVTISRTLHLEKLIGRLRFSDHCIKAHNSHWILSSLILRMKWRMLSSSSAYLKMEELLKIGFISSVNMQKRRGPIMFTCGTALVTIFHEENFPSH